MTNKFKSLFTGIISTAAILLSTTHAKAVDTGGYIGFGYGDTEDIILNEEDTGVKFYGGFTFDDVLGIEYSYVDLGTYLNNSLSQDGIAIEGVLYFPLRPSTDVFVKGGIFSWEVNTASATEYGTDPVFGAGIQIMFNRRTSMRIEWQQFQNVSGGDVELISLGLSRHF